MITGITTGTSGLGATNLSLAGGMAASASASIYPTQTIAGHEMVQLPGGYFVMGSADLQRGRPQDTPRWVKLRPFWISTTAVTENQYRKVMKGAGNPNAKRGDYPVTNVSWEDAKAYASKVGLRLPAGAEWEFAARGPVVNVREAMIEKFGSFELKYLRSFLEGQFENLTVGDKLGDGIEIYTDPEDITFLHFVRQGLPIFAWRVYGTLSGALTPEDAWYDKEEKGPAKVNWGRPNAYGLYNMSGNVREWVSAKDPDDSAYVTARGGSAFDHRPSEFLAAFRLYEIPTARDGSFGFRVAR